MDNKEMVEKILNDNGVKALIKTFENSYHKPSLVGGAIIDILEDRIPKDYDLKYSYNFSSAEIEEYKFEFIYKTKSALTLKKEGFVYQFLNRELNQFDFLISQCVFNLNGHYLQVDELSFKNKILIPSNFDDKTAIINSLLRIPHWKKKGYLIQDETYLSLIRALSNTPKLES